MTDIPWLTANLGAREINKHVKEDIAASGLKMPTKSRSCSVVIYGHLFELTVENGIKRLTIDGREPRRESYDSFPVHVQRQIYQLVHNAQRDLRQHTGYSQLQADIANNFFKAQEKRKMRL